MGLATIKPNTEGSLQLDFELGEDLIAGDPVHVYDDSGAKIKKVIRQASSAVSYGKAYYNDSCLVDTNTFVIVYYDANDSGNGKAVIGEVQPDLSIIFGTPVTFNTGLTYYLSVTKLDTEKFVVTYRDGGNSNHGTAIVGTISSGNNINFGSETVFNTATTNYTTCSQLDTDKFVVCYTDAGNSSYGTAIVGDVSGSTITFGSEYVYDSNGATYYHESATLGTNKFAVAYRESGSYGVVGTVSGTVITLGARSQFSTSNNSSMSTVKVDTDKFAVCYRDVGNSSYGTAIIGTVSGTTISGWGTPAVFQSEYTFHLDADQLDTNKFVINYGDNSAPYECRYSVASVSGTTITIDTTSAYYDGRLYYAAVTALDTDKFMLAFYDLNATTSYAIISTTDGIDTLGECIGILDESGSTGEQKKVILLGGISRQISGMTPGDRQYLQNNGTISDTVSDYPIGVALDTNILLITKGTDDAV